jgi:hypothetical protein
LFNGLDPQFLEPDGEGRREPDKQGQRIPAIFFRTEAGGEPVRDWLKSLSLEDRKRIGEDIKTIEFGWAIGLPVCKAMGDGICEVRTNLGQNSACTFLYQQEGADGPSTRIHQEDAVDSGHGFRNSQKEPI